MNKSVTLVSALYQLNRTRWKYSGFPPNYDRYIDWVRNLLSIDAPLYFFTDEYYYDHIISERKKYDPDLSKTVITKVPFDHLYFYQKYYLAESCLMASPEFRNKIFEIHSADMNYPLYHIINFSKIDFVQRSARDNKFNSTHFFWVDAGGFRENRNIYERKVWPTIKEDVFNDKITHFSHNLEFKIEPNKDHYFVSQIRNIQGTAWIVPKDLVDKFFSMIEDQVNTIINEKIVGSDEKVYDFLYTKNPELYQLNKCGWFKFYDVCSGGDTSEIPAPTPRQPEPLNNKKIFIDMGAHEQQGLSQFISKLSIDQSWEVHCFEPNNLLNLENRFKDLNVTMHPKAVWTKDGEVSINLYGLNRLSQGSIVVGTMGSDVLVDLYDVIKSPCIDVHKFINSFDRSDEIYIKMDIEWSEYDVLEYMLQKGWPATIKGIWIEWHGRHYEECNKRKNEIIKKIKPFGTVIEDWH